MICSHLFTPKYVCEVLIKSIYPCVLVLAARCNYIPNGFIDHHIILFSISLCIIRSASALLYALGGTKTKPNYMH